MFNVPPAWNKVNFANFTKLLLFVFVMIFLIFKNWADTEAQTRLQISPITGHHQGPAPLFNLSFLASFHLALVT